MAHTLLLHTFFDNLKLNWPKKITASIPGFSPGIYIIYIYADLNWSWLAKYWKLPVNMNPGLELSLSSLVNVVWLCFVRLLLRCWRSSVTLTTTLWRPAYLSIDCLSMSDVWWQLATRLVPSARKWNLVSQISCHYQQQLTWTVLKNWPSSCGEGLWISVCIHTA